MNPNESLISVFSNGLAKIPEAAITIDDVMIHIATDQHKAKIERIRGLIANGDPDAASSLKKNLTSFSISGHVTEGGRGQAMQEGRFVHSGWLQIDIDGAGLGDRSPEEARALLGNDKHVAMAFISPSGNGAKAIARIPVCKTKEEHVAAFQSAERYFATYGLRIDQSTKDPVRLMFASWDLDALGQDPAACKILPIRQAPPPPPRKERKVGASVNFPPPPHEGIHAWLMQAAWHCRANGMTEDDTITKFQSYDGTLRRRYQPTEVVDAVRKVFSAGPSDRAPTGKADDPAQAETLRERAYRMRFDAAAPPPPDETCMSIGGIPIAARGNLTVPQGKSKVGKSAVISAILGAANRGDHAAVGDTLKIEWEGDATGAIIHLDTEQSQADWHALVCRGITRSGLPEASDRLVSLPVIPFTRSERLAILRATLEHERKRLGAIDLVLIDGIADLCVSPNDEAEALELVAKVHALAQEFHCPIFCVLHENPSSDIGKTRGHLGSELNRKAFANLRIDKDTETGVSTVYGSDMRKQDIPKEHGFCFAWDEVAKMHTFQGRATGLKAANREKKATNEAREYWTKIFERAVENGSQRENSGFPAISPKDAVEIEREVCGNEELTKTDTMKHRMQRAEALGVLKKFDVSRWTLTAAGTAGK